MNVLDFSLPITHIASSQAMKVEASSISGDPLQTRVLLSRTLIDIASYDPTSTAPMTENLVVNGYGQLVTTTMTPDDAPVVKYSDSVATYYVRFASFTRGGSPLRQLYKNPDVTLEMLGDEFVTPEEVGNVRLDLVYDWYNNQLVDVSATLLPKRN